MDKLMMTGLGIASVLIGYKAGIYIAAYYQLSKEKQKEIIDQNQKNELKEK